MTNRSNISFVAIIVSCAVFISACGSDGSDTAGLSKEEVTSIPQGDATGAELSGDYAVTITTTACSGTCLIQQTTEASSRPS